MADVRTTTAGAVGQTRREHLRWLNFQSAWVFLFLILLIIIFTIREGTKFFDPVNFRNIALDASQLTLLAVGATVVIITAGIDLSISSVLVFSAIVGAKGETVS